MIFAVVMDWNINSFKPHDPSVVNNALIEEGLKQVASKYNQGFLQGHLEHTFERGELFPAGAYMHENPKPQLVTGSWSILERPSE